MIAIIKVLSIIWLIEIAWIIFHVIKYTIQKEDE